MHSAYEPRLARVAAMIADPARSRMLAYLLDGHRASAGELAQAGSVAASTASAHLAKLEAAGLVAAERRGRHRYFRLADAEVAQALEALALVAERSSHERAWDGAPRRELRFARRCYGHLAGTLGVALLDGLLRRGHVVADADTDAGGGFALSDGGATWLRSIGVDPETLPRARRLAYGCLDWSERRDHLAGPLAARLLDHFVASGWLRAEPGSAGRPRTRVLALTPTGQRTLLPMLAA